MDTTGWMQAVPFNVALQDALEQRSLSVAELARRSGVSYAKCARVLRKNARLDEEEMALIEGAAGFAPNTARIMQDAREASLLQEYGSQLGPDEPTPAQPKREIKLTLTETSELHVTAEGYVGRKWLATAEDGRVLNAWVFWGAPDGVSQGQLQLPSPGEPNVAVMSMAPAEAEPR